jgi:WD40 repeat protein
MVEKSIKDFLLASE